MSTPSVKFYFDGNNQPRIFSIDSLSGDKQALCQKIITEFTTKNILVLSASEHVSPSSVLNMQNCGLVVWEKNAMESSPVNTSKIEITFRNNYPTVNLNVPTRELSDTRDGMMRGLRKKWTMVLSDHQKDVIFDPSKVNSFDFGTWES